jgi:hypothetical protein
LCKQNTHELAVDVSTNSHGAAYGLDVGLLDEDFAGLSVSRCYNYQGVKGEGDRIEEKRGETIEHSRKMQRKQ